MANHASALRKFRHDERRRQINKMNISKMRTSIKRLRKAVAGNDLEQIKKVLQETVSVIDKTAKKGTIHTKTGDRYKSRIYKLVNSKGA